MSPKPIHAETLISVFPGYAKSIERAGRDFSAMTWPDDSSRFRPDYRPELPSRERVSKPPSSITACLGKFRITRTQLPLRQDGV
jgi:hypothetical protein